MALVHLLAYKRKIQLNCASTLCVKGKYEDIDKRMMTLNGIKVWCDDMSFCI